MPAEPLTAARLAVLVGGTLHGDGAVPLVDVTHDSRDAGPGVLFVAVRGAHVDGHRFVGDAITGGCPAVCVEDASVIPPEMTAIVVPDTRRVLGLLAAACHGNPSQHLRVVGVTGTNGKTTTTHMIESICVAAGIPEAIIGTVGAHIRGQSVPLERTTPEASDFQRLLHTMVDAGVEVAAVEVSSHALALGRVDGTRFSVGAFTNLSQDHLDFHGDMAAYEAAKASLFDRCDRAVVWIDDPAGRRIAAGLSIPVTTVGTDDADLVVGTPDLGFPVTRFPLRTPRGAVTIEIPLPGRFNAANAAMAAGCALALDLDLDAVRRGLADLPPVPGRFELVETAASGTVVVDYAHTPEGVSQAIAAAREILNGRGRVIVVVGAGGDRDRAKRPLMGTAAAAADLAIFTSDNPRTEDPEAILAEVVAGARGGSAEVVVDPDRRHAIRTALQRAAIGDVLLILGKGHEQGQDFGDRVHPFDDRVVARQEAMSS